jgi:hypothetical protein
MGTSNLTWAILIDMNLNLLVIWSTHAILQLFAGSTQTQDQFIVSPHYMDNDLNAFIYSTFPEHDYHTYMNIKWNFFPSSSP